MSKERIPINSETLVLNALGILLDRLELAVKEIRELMEPKDWIPIEYKGNLVGRIRKVENRIEFIPVESLQIKTDNRAIGWLKRDVLEKSKEKHGWNYQIFEKDGILNRIVIYGEVPDEKIKEMINPIGWTFAAAGGLISEEPKKAEKPEISLEDARKMLPNELLEKISLEKAKGYIIIRPKQYLGSKLFSELADIIINKLNGEYISAGRDSHFRIQSAKI